MKTKKEICELIIINGGHCGGNMCDECPYKAEVRLACKIKYKTLEMGKFNTYFLNKIKIAQKELLIIEIKDL